MKLIAQMVGKNESQRFLVPVVSRLRTIVDEIVFTDDASTDETPDIMRAAGAHVKVLDEPLFTTDEGLLRATAWSHLENYAEEGDWILAIDCDEMFYGAENLPFYFNQSDYDVLGVTFYHMWNNKQYRVDKLWGPTVSSRLFRYKEGGQFLDRKLACGSEPTYVQEAIRARRFLPQTPFRMKHLGYILDYDKVAKHERYMELDQGRYHNLDHLNSIIDTQPTLIDWKD